MAFFVAAAAAAAATTTTHILISSAKLFVQHKVYIYFIDADAFSKKAGAHNISYSVN